MKQCLECARWTDRMQILDVTAQIAYAEQSMSALDVSVLGVPCKQLQSLLHQQRVVTSISGEVGEDHQAVPSQLVLTLGFGLQRQFGNQF